MPPPFVPVRTPEESRSPHSTFPEGTESPKPKTVKPVPMAAKAKPVVDAAKSSNLGMSSAEKVPLGLNTIVISTQQQQQQQQKPSSGVSVIRPQSSSAPAQNGYSKVEAGRLAPSNGNTLLERKHVITNPKQEIERIQNNYNGKF